MGKTVHGARYTRLYAIWTDMKSRCYNANDTAYHYYGGRGIWISEEWRHSFLRFSEWASANGYSEDLTLDRVDNEGPYGPWNCAWKTRKEQMRNSRASKQFLIEGESKTLIEWSEDPRCEVQYGTLRKRSSKGWPLNRGFLMKQ